MEFACVPNWNEHLGFLNITWLCLEILRGNWLSIVELHEDMTVKRKQSPFRWGCTVNFSRILFYFHHPGSYLKNLFCGNRSAIGLYQRCAWLCLKVSLVFIFHMEHFKYRLNQRLLQRHFLLSRIRFWVHALLRKHLHCCASQRQCFVLVVLHLELDLHCE